MKKTKKRSTAVAVQQPQQDSFIAMIERAARDPSVDVGKMKELLDMRAREEAHVAERRFGEALAQAKRNLPAIMKTRQVNLGGNRSYKYEDLPAVMAAVDPKLADVGLAYRYRTQSDANSVTVTCILFGHGHSEENSLTAAPDKSGSKNDVQAIGSIVTYLQRYTLKAALGVAASIDDDGQSAGPVAVRPPPTLPSPRRPAKVNLQYKADGEVDWIAFGSEIVTLSKVPFSYGADDLVEANQEALQKLAKEAEADEHTAKIHGRIMSAIGKGETANV